MRSCDSHLCSVGGRAAPLPAAHPCEGCARGGSSATKAQQAHSSRRVSIACQACAPSRNQHSRASLQSSSKQRSSRSDDGAAGDRMPRQHASASKQRCRADSSTDAEQHPPKHSAITCPSRRPTPRQEARRRRPSPPTCPTPWLCPRRPRRACWTARASPWPRPSRSSDFIFPGQGVS